MAFAAPAGTTLDANTSYSVVVYRSGSTTGTLRLTGSNSEDSGGHSDWAIADTGHYLDNGTWTAFGNELYGIRVNGAAQQSTSTNANLSALTASTHTSSTGTFTSHPLTPSTFAAATTSYTALVGNARTHLKLTPTVAASGATVKVGKGTSLTTVTSGSASAAIALSVGSNAITVEVTAQDNTTKKTYTVTVTRYAAGQVWAATFTPEEFSWGIGCISKSECDSQLTENSFTVGNQSYHFLELAVRDNGALFFSLSAANLALTNLKFCVGSTAFEFSIFAVQFQFWINSGVTWTAGTPVSLSIGTSCPRPRATPEDNGGNNNGDTPPDDTPSNPGGGNTGGGNPGGGNTPVDLTPGFGAAGIADQSWVAGAPIAALTLPAATGGDGTLTYRLTPALPSGVTLAARRLSGTPAAAQASTRYAWTATDADGDTATLTFAIAVERSRESRIKESVKKTLADLLKQTVTQAGSSIGTRFADIGPSGFSLAGQWVPLHGLLAGSPASSSPAAAYDASGPCAAAPFAVAGYGASPGCGAAGWSRSMTAGELLGASAFSVHLGAAEGAPVDRWERLWSMWGRGDFGTFAGGGDAGLRYGGELRTGWLGVDARAGPWVAGLAVSRVEGEADYAFADAVHAGRGRMETELTAVYPYGRWTLGEGFELRAVAGAGTGEVRHEDGDGEAASGDLSMRMGSVEFRRVLSDVAGVALAVRGDAAVTRIETDHGPTAIHGLSADSWRVRAGLEASRRFTLSGANSVEPFLEAVARQDGGDGLEGSGVELAGGVRYAAPGVFVEARGRWLAAHSEADAEERGVSVTARAGPGADGRGLFLAFSPRWGAATGGAQALWGEELPTASASDAGGAVDARVGYGFGVAAAGVLTPFAEAGFAGSEGRRLRLGTRFDALRAAFGMELAGERSEHPSVPPEHALRLDLMLRF